MNNLEYLLRTKQIEKKKALMPFIMAGSPNLEITKQVLMYLEEIKCDVVELGVPFSDPIADGPVIAKDHEIGIRNKVTLSKVFDFMRELREICNIPIVLMIYSNLIEQFGVEIFFRTCKEVNILGVIIPDCPCEQLIDYKSYSTLHNVSIIQMIAPTSKERLEKIVENAEGFLYCVSSLGVTGVRECLSTHLEPMIQSIKAITDIPMVVGFGIHTSEQIEKVKKEADGIIIGSALSRVLREEGLDAFKKYIKKIRQIT